MWTRAANPATTRDEVAEYLEGMGVNAPAAQTIPPTATPPTSGRP